MYKDCIKLMMIPPEVAHEGGGPSSHASTCLATAKF